MISHEYKMIFIPVPRCGSTAVLKAFGDPLKGGHPTWRHYAERYPKEWATYAKWAPIRDPWSRLRSCYNYARMPLSYWHPYKVGPHPDRRICSLHSFESVITSKGFGPALLLHEGWRPQSEWWYGGDGIELVPMIAIREYCMERFGVDVPYMNASPQEPHEFTPIMNAIVRRTYPWDIEAYERAIHERQREAATSGH